MLPPPVDVGGFMKMAAARKYVAVVLAALPLVFGFAADLEPVAFAPPVRWDVALAAMGRG